MKRLFRFFFPPFRPLIWSFFLTLLAIRNFFSVPGFFHFFSGKTHRSPRRALTRPCQTLCLGHSLLRSISSACSLMDVFAPGFRPKFFPFLTVCRNVSPRPPGALLPAVNVPFFNQGPPLPKCLPSPRGGYSDQRRVSPLAKGRW